MHERVKIADKSFWTLKKNSSIGKDFLKVGWKDTEQISVQVALFSVKIERNLSCPYSILDAVLNKFEIFPR